MIDFDSLRQAEKHLEGEITDRQKRLVQMCTEQHKYVSLSAEIGAKQVLENEIADRIAALKKLQVQRNCNCCEKELSAPGFRIRLTYYEVRNGDLLETRALIRVVCIDCFGTFATRREVDLAIERLTAADWQRIKKFAARRTWTLGAASRGRTGEDLYGEAIRLTFEGAEGEGVGKRWNKAVDFVRHLTVAMRNISYRWRKDFEADTTFECEAVTCGSDGQEYSLLDHFPSDDPSADRYLIAEEQVEHIVQRFENDGTAIAVLQGLSKGMTWPQIMQEYGLREAAVKRIRMKLRRKNRSGGQPHTVRKASNAEEAVRLYRQCGPFKVVMIDYDLPKEEGLALAKGILKINSSQAMIITAFDYAHEEEVPRPMELMHIPVLVGTHKSEISTALERLRTTSRCSDGTGQSCPPRSAGNAPGTAASM